MELGLQGRKRRLGIEDEYWHLILAGAGTVEPFKLAGIGRKTGYQWRAEGPGLQEAVQGKLKLKWSPEQIAAWLRNRYRDRPRWHVCHEDDLRLVLASVLRRRFESAMEPACRPVVSFQPPLRVA